MKRALAAAAIALSLFTGSVALADDYGRHNGRWHDGRRHDDGRRHHDGRRDWRRDHYRRDWHHDHRRDGRRDWRHDHRRDYRHDWRHNYRYRYHDGYHFRTPAHRPRWGNRYRPAYYGGYRVHHWRRGDYLPIEYRHTRYVVDDYYAYGLRSPGRGCHWVRVNGDLVLAAITTGIVLDIAYNNYY